MKPRKSPLLLVALLAVLALVLGTVGPADAGALTVKRVKKIAARVVAKKAPGLSVAHAATAGTASTADNLGGKAPSTYLNKAYVFPLAGTSPDGTITFPINGVPAGKYLVNYNVAASAGAGFFVCYFGTFGSKRVAALGSVSGNWWVTGAGYLDTSAGTPNFECTGSGPITIPGPSVVQSEVVLTRLDDVTVTNTVGSKAPGRGANAVH